MFTSRASSAFPMTPTDHGDDHRGDEGHFARIMVAQQRNKNDPQASIVEQQQAQRTVQPPPFLPSIMSSGAASPGIFGVSEIKVASDVELSGRRLRVPVELSVVM